jgi:predicted RNase H-like HicB family nuclease
MRFGGRIIKIDRYWAVEVPILGVVTQGRTKKEAYEMIADAIESLVNKEDFKVEVYPGKGEYFEVYSKDLSTMIAFLLRRQRTKHGLSLAEVAKRLGAKSLNTYARYEQGKSVPTVEKFNQLLSAVSPEMNFVLVESQDQRLIQGTH